MCCHAWLLCFLHHFFRFFHIRVCLRRRQVESTNALKHVGDRKALDVASMSVSYARKKQCAAPKANYVFTMFHVKRLFHAIELTYQQIPAISDPSGCKLGGELLKRPRTNLNLKRLKPQCSYSGTKTYDRKPEEISAGAAYHI